MVNLMKQFNSLSELLNNIHHLNHNEWIYTNLDLWYNNPNDCAFYYISDEYINDLSDDEIYLDDEGLEMPILVQEFNLRTFLMVGNIWHIYHKNDNDIQKTINEINHYREFDDFLS